MFGTLRGRVSTHAWATIILWIKAEGVGVRFWHAEGLVTISCGVVADVDLVVVGAAGVVFDDTEVIFRVVGLGHSGEGLEFSGAALLGLPIEHHVGDKMAVSNKGIWGFLCDCHSALFRWAGVNARNLEGVLDCLTFLASVATLGNFRVVRVVEEGRRVRGTIRDPDVHNGNLCMAHALSDKIDGDQVFDVLFFKTLGLPEGSGMILGKNTRNGLSKGIFDLECNMCLVLHRNLDRDVRVHR